MFQKEVIPIDEYNRRRSHFKRHVKRFYYVLHAREWMASYFIPAVLPILIDQLRAENALGLTPSVAPGMAR